MVNYLDSLLPITGARLWGPAKPYTTGLRSKLVRNFFCPPYDTSIFFLLLGGRMDGRAYLPFPKFFGKKIELFFFIFFKCLQLSGGTILNFFQYQQAKNRARRANMDPKIDTFCQVDTRDLSILGSKKSYSRLFRSCFGVVQEVFGHCFRP